MIEDALDNKIEHDHIGGANISGTGIIVGKQIHIAGSFVVKVSNEAKSIGLNLLLPKYFEEHKNTIGDFESWKEGFPFNKIESIMEKSELRREKVIDQIKSRLDNPDSPGLLLLGESGTSKTTLLMEIMCEYFCQGYQILYNYGDMDIQDAEKVVNFIEGLLKEGNKVMVAVDNAHQFNTAAIYYIMDLLCNHQFSQNVKFILAARLPEFEFFQQKDIEHLYLQSLRKLMSKKEKFIYYLPNFDQEDIYNFIKKYGNVNDLNKIYFQNKPEQFAIIIERLSKIIYQETKGVPILVKFLVLREGLAEDVFNRYNRYLARDANNLTTMLVCSLLDLSGLQISENILKDKGLLEFAYNLDRATLYYNSETFEWKTIHPRWDIELFSLLFKETNKKLLFERKIYLEKAILTILSIENENVTNPEHIRISIIELLYLLVKSKVISLIIIDNIIKEQIPFYIKDKNKIYYLYATVIAPTYLDFGKYDEAIITCDEAIDINPNYINAWNNKGNGLDYLGKYDEALACYNKALEIDPKHEITWNNKGNTLFRIRKYDEALACYNKALEIDSNYARAWNNKGTYLDYQGKYDEALACYNKALEISPILGIAWHNKGNNLAKLGMYTQAIGCYDKALEIDANDDDSRRNKSICLLRI